MNNSLLTVSILNSNNTLDKTLNFSSIFSLECGKKGNKYKATNGEIFNTTYYNIEKHPHSVPLNIHYTARLPWCTGKSPDGPNGSCVNYFPDPKGSGRGPCTGSYQGSNQLGSQGTQCVADPINSGYCKGGNPCIVGFPCSLCLKNAKDCNEACGGRGGMCANPYSTDDSSCCYCYPTPPPPPTPAPQPCEINHRGKCGGWGDCCKHYPESGCYCLQSKAKCGNDGYCE